VEQVSQSLGKD
jgi:hypothetical protein